METVAEMSANKRLTDPLGSPGESGVTSSGEQSHCNINHEFYRANFDGLQSALNQTRPGPVHVLDRGEVVIDRNGEKLRILGATLWTDYAINGTPEISMLAAAGAINDHRLISRQDGSRFTPDQARDEHWKSRAWLSKKIVEPFSGSTIIVTHHVPHPIGHNRAFPANGPLTPAFQSNCDDIIHLARDNGVVAFIYGHHHANQVEELDGMLFLSAQLGYPSERTNWKGPGVLDTVTRQAIR